MKPNLWTTSDERGILVASVLMVEEMEIFEGVEVLKTRVVLIVKRG